MKKYFLFFAISVTIISGALSVSAQCDPNVQSPIKCSYYNEGYQDGSNDASNNRNSDYKRYRDKYDRRYEDFFRDGYQSGYNSQRPSTRWTNSQRSAYDSGYSIGQNDRRQSNQSRSSESRIGQYDQNIGLYFQQGYADGFSDRRRQYDVPVNGVPPVDPPIFVPPFPGTGGGRNGSGSWSGRVDDRANIVIRGNQIYAENVAGNGTQTSFQNMSGSLPRRDSTISARKTDGRGNVSIIQQPNRSNNFTGIIQISDTKSGSGDYKVDFSWTGSGNNVEEPYSSGSVTWRGRVDQTVQIIIAGTDVQSIDTTSSGLSGVTFNMNGYLANRPGSVNVRKRKGRGTVTVIEQPSFNNGFAATVQIFDPSGGADNYELEISW